MADWEAKITLYRNGRRVHFNDAHGESAADALYSAHNDIELWAEAHRESDSNTERHG